MNAVSISVARTLVRRAEDPVAEANRRIADVYVQKSRGLCDDRIKEHLKFEIYRSALIEEVRLCDGDFQKAQATEKEIQELKQMSGDQRNSQYLKSTSGRFIGAVRAYVKGRGYAVSVRKRRNHNQDTFLITKDPLEKTLGVFDGLGSLRQSAISSAITASYLLDTLRARKTMDKQTILDISRKVCEYQKNTRGKRWNGASTFLSATRKGNRMKIIRVGDSTPFLIKEGYFRRKIIEIKPIGSELGLPNVIGQPMDFIGISGFEDGVEEYEVRCDRMVLVSDGATNAFDSPFVRQGWDGMTIVQLLHNILAQTKDCVVIGEKLLRSILIREITQGYDDDVTIVVEDPT